MAFLQEYKLADYFSVIGLDENLKIIQSNGECKYSSPSFLSLGAILPATKYCTW
jgi:hypothetical protein